MDPQNASFKQVMDLLREQNVPEEEIAQILENLTQTASTKFYAEAMAEFSDEDLKEIEDASTNEEANTLIAQKFQEKTGRDPEMAMQQFLNTFAQGFIVQYQKDKANQQV